MALFGICCVVSGNIYLSVTCVRSQEGSAVVALSRESEAMTGWNMTSLSKLNSLFEEDLIFKNPDLRLIDVARSWEPPHLPVLADHATGGT